MTPVLLARISGISTYKCCRLSLDNDSPRRNLSPAVEDSWELTTLSWSTGYG